MTKLAFKIAALFSALALALTACSSSNDNNTAGSPSQQTLNVYAAASLKGVFTELESEFEKENPGVDVAFNFAGSSDLVTQITEGAPATVFASADTKNMTKLQDAKRVEGTPKQFAKNTLQIAVPPANRAGISNLQDVTKSNVRRVICAVPVPCGNATEQLAKNAQLNFKPASEEQSVTDVLNKVIADEADAGIVYVTDVKGAGDKVAGIEIPTNVNVINDYPITLVQGSSDQELGQKFIDLVLSDKGQQVLHEAGFLAP
ncbi:MAG: molybdate ABC transporter substrate-binding protein [Candidatus Nanopelagicales bacterium]